MKKRLNTGDIEMFLSALEKRYEPATLKHFRSMNGSQLKRWQRLYNRWETKLVAQAKVEVEVERQRAVMENTGGSEA